MKRSQQVFVTLSDELMKHLLKTAHEQHVSLRWLVAGLICDTLEANAECEANEPAQLLACP